MLILQTMDRFPRTTIACRMLVLFLSLALLAGCQSDSTAPGATSDDSASPAAVVTARTNENEGPYSRLTEIGDRTNQSDAADSGIALPQFGMPTRGGNSKSQHVLGSSAIARSDIAESKAPGSEITHASQTPDLVLVAPNPKTDDSPNSPQLADEIFEMRANESPIARGNTEPYRSSAYPGMAQESAQPQVSDNSSESEALLPWGPSTPSPELQAISERAEQMVRRAFNLAERGALYSARTQFANALRSMTEALDLDRNTTAHTRALTAGLRALDEVNDFVPGDVRTQTDMNLQLIVDAHHTPVLKNQPLDRVTRSAAQRMYLTYAQEQLAAAGADQSVSSLALYGLGKVCAAPSALHGPRGKVDEGKAVVFYQSALIVDGQNFMAANELGVVLTRFGRWADARSALENAVATSGTPTSWRNLAVVCDRMGDGAKAAEARHQAETAVARLQQAGHATAGSKYAIEMVDAAEFAKAHSGSIDTTDDRSVAGNASTPQQQPTISTAAKPTDKAGIWPWNRK